MHIHCGLFNPKSASESSKGNSTYVPLRTRDIFTPNTYYRPLTPTQSKWSTHITPIPPTPSCSFFHSRRTSFVTTSLCFTDRVITRWGCVRVLITTHGRPTAGSLMSSHGTGIDAISTTRASFNFASYKLSSCGLLVGHHTAISGPSSALSAPGVGRQASFWIQRLRSS